LGVWKQYLKDGIPFYHNKLTKQSTWRLPPGAVLVGQQQQQQQQKQEPLKQQHQPQEPQQLQQGQQPSQDPQTQHKQMQQQHPQQHSMVPSVQAADATNLLASCSQGAAAVTHQVRTQQR
jgi:hypothetical protein